MKIYRRLIPCISKEIIRHLLAESTVEIADGHRDDAELDIASVLVNYLNDEDQLNQDAKDILERRGLPFEKFGMVKRGLAESRNMIIGDNAFDYVLEQMVEILFHSGNFTEIFAEDHDLKRIMRNTIRRYMGVDAQLDKEVRGRLRHLREGTPDWEIEYEKVIEQMRHSHGLS